MTRRTAELRCGMDDEERKVERGRGGGGGFVRCAGEG